MCGPVIGVSTLDSVAPPPPSSPPAIGGLEPGGGGGGAEAAAAGPRAPPRPASVVRLPIQILDKLSL